MSIEIENAGKVKIVNAKAAGIDIKDAGSVEMKNILISKDELKCVDANCLRHLCPDEHCYPCKDLRGYQSSKPKVNK